MQDFYPVSSSTTNSTETAYHTEAHLFTTGFPKVRVARFKVLYVVFYGSLFVHSYCFSIVLYVI
jgi:hypothetical protein